LAVRAYRTQAISLGKAASIAGVSWARMKDILVEHGVQPRLGPETLEELQEEVEVLRKFMAKRETARTRLEE
jgi:predicted HTH domain antitoxin